MASTDGRANLVANEEGDRAKGNHYCEVHGVVPHGAEAHREDEGRTQNEFRFM